MRMSRLLTLILPGLLLLAGHVLADTGYPPDPRWVRIGESLVLAGLGNGILLLSVDLEAGIVANRLLRVQAWVRIVNLPFLLLFVLQAFRSPAASPAGRRIGAMFGMLVVAGAVMFSAMPAQENASHARGDYESILRHLETRLIAGCGDVSIPDLHKCLPNLHSIGKQDGRDIVAFKWVGPDRLEMGASWPKEVTGARMILEVDAKRVLLKCAKNAAIDPALLAYVSRACRRLDEAAALAEASRR